MSSIYIYIYFKIKCIKYIFPARCLAVFYFHWLDSQPQQAAFLIENKLSSSKQLETGYLQLQLEMGDVTKAFHAVQFLEWPYVYCQATSIKQVCSENHIKLYLCLLISVTQLMVPLSRTWQHGRHIRLTDPFNSHKCCIQVLLEWSLGSPYSDFDVFIYVMLECVTNMDAI